MNAMSGDDPLRDHWIRVGVLLDSKRVANVVFPPHSTVTIGSSEGDTIRVPEGTFAESFCLLSEGTLVHTLTGMTVRMAHGEVVQAASAEELGAAFRTHADRMNISVRVGLRIFVMYVATEAEAEDARRGTERLLDEAQPPRSGP